MVYLFDIDGTLIHSQKRVGRRAFQRACAEAMGLAEALEGVVLSGNTDPYILEEACRLRLGRSPTAAEREAVFAAYLRVLEEELAPDGAVEVLPAVRETLGVLGERGALVGLATGNIEPGARLKLGRVGLWEHFAFGGFGSDSHERAELVRAAIGRARQRRGGALAAEEVTVIGDTPRDVSAAHAAGARAVGVATGPVSVDALRAAGADRVYPTLEGFLAEL